MRKYRVDCDITMSTHLVVFALSEEDAQKKAEDKIRKEPFWYGSKPDSFVAVEATDANEEM